ncbi:MAG: ABC transporter permease [Anaerolineae bacterium]|nr:ABC transporter permease [Anaerolineae bacterium]
MKSLAIAWKDLSITFRDRNALLLMILAPLLLSFIIGASFGNLFSGGSVPFDQIPVLVVNADAGESGQQFVAALQSQGLADLLLVTETDDLAAARTLVQQGEARAAVYIPPEFSTAVRGTNPESSAFVAFYADPSATITPNIVRGIVVQITNNFNTGAIAAQVTVAQLMAQADRLGPGLAQIGPVLEEQIQEQVGGGDTAVTINLHQVTVGETEEPVEISPFAFFAPSMGLLFLMFAMMDSTRTILEEEKAGTLSRLLTTPIGHSELLLGKVGGVFLTGIVQFYRICGCLAAAVSTKLGALCAGAGADGFRHCAGVYRVGTADCRFCQRHKPGRHPGIGDFADICRFRWQLCGRSKFSILAGSVEQDHH